MKSEVNYGTLPLSLTDEGNLLLLDQRKLPYKTEFFDATTFENCCIAIKDMIVRGAPSIGCVAAFGLAMEGVRLAEKFSQKSEFLRALDQACLVIQATRPTAVNLMNATNVIKNKAHSLGLDNTGQIANELMLEAKRYMQESIDVNKKLSDYGVDLVPDKAGILTHCNAGSIAACGWGTALGVMRSAQMAGKNIQAFVGETRPRQQGARLTMWELAQDNIPATLICDTMTGHFMKEKSIDMIVVGADRICANGDTANKIGTYNLAVLAKYHNIPFYVAAPLSTFDPELASGDLIPIEVRDGAEVTHIADLDNRVSVTIADAKTHNPAFDVTPASLIHAFITEAGILRPDFKQSISRTFCQTN